MATEFPQRFVCWHLATAEQVLVTTALENIAAEGSRSQFLATHLPIQDFEIGGSNAAEVTEPTEEALYQALSAPSCEHAFCVVLGAAGAGKSHLVRWLKYRWEIEKDFVLLIERADGSLEGSLTAIRERLPAQFQIFLQNLGARDNISAEGKRAMFKAALSVTLRPNTFDEPVLHADWCAEWRAADLVGHPYVIEHWNGPARILDILAGSSGQRNSRLARFTLFDIAELGSMQPELHDFLSARVVRLARNLHKESKAIFDAQREGMSAEGALEQLSAEVPTSVQLLEALNARLNAAIQRVLNISAAQLKDLFFRVRRELKSEGRRLVLLLEDITSIQGIDNQLVDVLVTKSSTREQQDLCPIISVVGVTPDYFRQYLRANYRDRITHLVQLGGEGRSDEVAFLQSAEAQVDLAARYLRACRLSINELNRWSDESGPVPNRCTTCTYRTGCHSTFGEHHGVGLYPLSSLAITNLFSRLFDPTGSHSLQTPRGMIQGVLSPAMKSADDVGHGNFPSSLIEHAQLSRDPTLPEPQQQRLRVLTDDEGIRERLRRLLLYWGDTSYRTDENGAQTFSGIHREVFDSFGLPWVADVAATGEGAPVTLPRESRSSSREKPETPTPKARTVPVRAGGTSQPSVQDLDSWKPGETQLANPSHWNKKLYTVVVEVAPKAGVPNWIAKKLFTENSVLIAGTGQQQERHLQVPAEPWLKAGLSAQEMIASAKDEAEYRYSCNAISILRRRLRALAREHYLDRIHRVSRDTDAIPSIAIRILCMRALLAGQVAATDEPVTLWRWVMRQQDATLSALAGHVPRWTEIVALTNAAALAIRDMLRAWLAVDEKSQFYADAAPVLRSLREFMTSLDFGPPLNQFPTNQANEVTKTAEYQEKMARLCTNLTEDEFEMLRDAAAQIRGSLRGKRLRQLVSEIEQVVKPINEHLASRAHNELSDWMRIKSALQAFLQDIARTKIVESFIDSSSTSSQHFPFQDRRTAFAWAAAAPAEDVQQLTKLLANAESTLSELQQRVAEFLASVGSTEAQSAEIVRRRAEFISQQVKIAGQAL